jgi:hypothetical protein
VRVRVQLDSFTQPGDGLATIRRRADGGVHTCVRGFHGPPFHNPVRLVVMRPRCPGVIGR